MNAKYLLFPIGIITLILYFSTFLLSNINFIRKKTHRQIWNSLLLVTFLITAILGLLLAIQVNYKLKIPLIKEILVWHVDFGIGMALIAVFHFTWHWSYYLNMFRKPKESATRTEKNTRLQTSDVEPEFVSVSEKQLYFPLLLLGFTTVITQIILLREFLSVFQGNELVTGLILSSWMILTGLGAYIGRYNKYILRKNAFLFYQLVVTGLLPIITVTLLDTLKNIVFEPGIAISPFQIAGSAIILLLPFCLFSGFSFTFFASAISRQQQHNRIDIAYALEAAGSVTGGLLFSFLLVYIFTTYQVLALLFLINAIVAFFYGKRIKSKQFRIISLTLSIFLFIVSLFLHPDIRIKSFLFPNQKITYLKDTPYGNLVVTRIAGQLNFYENNMLLFTTENTISNEEAVHYAMLQHPSPKRILLVSGGITGLAREIEKYHVDSIDYVELNPWLIEVANRFTGNLASERLTTIMKDARLYIKNCSRKYDVALINLPEPSTAQLNRYYTIEFFRELKSKLKKRGVISLGLPSTANYLSKEAIMVNSILYNTLHKVFKEIIIIQGERDYFIASDRNLHLDIAQLVELRGLNNEYVNSYYIDDNSLEERNNYIIGNLQPDAPVNSDFEPVAYFHQVGFWLSQFHINATLFSISAVLLLFLMAYFLSRLNPVALGMFTAGFTGSSFEIIIIMAFQIIYGYVYHTIGIIISVFMAGLAIGAIFRNRFMHIIHRRNYMLIQLMIATFAFLLPAAILLMKKFSIHTFAIQAGFIILMLLIAFLVGILFSMATILKKADFSKTAASVYSIDLAGSALGALFTAVLLIPILGLINYSLVLGVLNILAISTFILKKSTAT
jgi:spermidine synthase